ncbi:MAG: DUF975 family protein [Bacteroidaceae bacterium]
MKVNSQIRTEARVTLRGNWGALAVVTLVYILLNSVGNITDKLLGSAYIQCIWVLLMLPLVWSYSVLFLSLTRGNGGTWADLFCGYKDFSRIFCTSLLASIYTLLWSCLLIVPGIIKNYSYAMIPYILKDEPMLKNNAAIERSMVLMDGYKMKLFLLSLSFLGWFLLCVLSLGIGLLWLIPYISTSYATFYEDVKKDYEVRIQATAKE